MTVLFVVDRARQWPFEISGSSGVSARSYLIEPAYETHAEAKVVNLCRVERYQGRIGVFDGRPLYAAQYRMAPGHWQVIKREGDERVQGQTIAFSVGEVPQIVIDTAVRAANLIGRNLYGVDLKQSGEKCWLIEVNVNPNIDAGNEDQILGDALYREILGVFARRIREKRMVTSTAAASPLPAP